MVRATLVGQGLLASPAGCRLSRVASVCEVLWLDATLWQTTVNTCNTDVMTPVAWLVWGSRLKCAAAFRVLLWRTRGHHHAVAT